MGLAVDANSMALGSDQRGAPFARIFGESVDIGAFEAQTLALVVDTTDDIVDADDGKLSLREAILAANGNAGPETITFDVALAGGTITLNGTQLPKLLDNLTIMGPTGGVTLDGDDKSRIMEIDATATADISNLTFTHGNAAVTGGGIYNFGLLTLTDCTFKENFAGVFGGAMESDGTLIATRCTFIDNETNGKGGAFYNYLETSQATLTDCTFTNNSARTGGGIYNDTALLILSDCDLIGNTAGDSAGGIYNEDGDVTLTDCTLSGNTAEQNAGAIYNQGGSVRLRNSLLSGNSCATSGGAIFNDGTLELTNCTLSGNSSDQYAGGIENEGPLTATNCTFSENSAGSSGGGIFNFDGGMTLTGCTFLGNTAGTFGGAIFNQTDATLVNCTLSGNSALTSGGGIDNFQADLTLTNCTIVLNQSPIGGGIENTEGTVTLNNTLVAGNTTDGSTPNDLAGTGYVGGNNLIGDAGSAGDLTTATGNLLGDGSGGVLPIASIINTTLAFNGGRTQTHALAANSAALNAGSNALAVDADDMPLGFDQRGTPFVRAFGSSVDIGAYETQTVSLVVDTTDDTIDDDDGFLSLREALLAASNPGDDTITFAATLGGATILLNGTRLPDISDGLTITGPTGGITIDANQQSGIVSINEFAVVSLSGLTLRNGSATAVAAGIHNLGTLEMTDCTLSGNSGGSFGGAIYNERMLRLTNCIFSENSGESGGGIYNRGTAELTDCTLSDNFTTVQSGGGIVNFGTLTLTGCTLRDNVAASSGGGIANFGTLTLTDSSLSGNSAGSVGGGLASFGGGTTATVTGSTFSENTAGSGGGIYNQAEMTLINSTVSGNTSQQHGGGVVNDNGAELTAINCTIVLNQDSLGGSQVPSGGGIYNSFATLTLHNTLVAGNTKGNNPGTPNDIVNDSGTVSGSNNLVGDANTSGGLTAANGNILGNGSGGVLPLEQIIDIVLSDNGGATRTHALAQGSRAVNAGDNALALDDMAVALAFDQRGTGFARRVGAVDIGAFEVQAAFSGGFDGPDGSDLGDDFILTSGRFTLMGGQAVAQGNKPAQATVAGTFTNVAIDLDVSLTGNGSRAGVIARYTPKQGNRPESYYWGRLIKQNGRTFAEILRYKNGVVKELGRVRVDLRGDAGQLRFEVLGSSLKLFVDGELVVSATDNGLSGPGLTGIRAKKGAGLDNLVVNELMEMQLALRARRR